MTFAIYFIIFISFFFLILNILPVASPLSAQFASSIVYMASFMSAWNFLLPITELLICVGIVTVFEVAILLWHFIRWVIHVIRGTTSA